MSLLGAIVFIAGASALYNHAILADETGISGWNPALWVEILAGMLITILGSVQFVLAMNSTAAESQSR